MIAVLDASAAMEIALNKEYTKEFKNKLKECDLVIAPNTFASEITNAFWKYGTHKELSEENCQNGIDYCLGLIDDYIDTNSMCKEVLFESIHRNHPAYDLFYIVLARRNNAVLISRDVKMKKIAKNMNVLIS
jgi:predicted nucleic acid-binding protein